MLKDELGSSKCHQEPVGRKACLVVQMTLFVGRACNAVQGKGSHEPIPSCEMTLGSSKAMRMSPLAPSSPFQHPPWDSSLPLSSLNVMSSPWFAQGTRL